MRMIRVAIVYRTSLDEADVRSGVGALRVQLHEDFAPACHIDAELELVAGGLGAGRPGCWELVLLDKPLPDDARHALGNRTKAGHPLVPVLIDNLEPGHDWTHWASHALLEMLVDPDATAAVVRVDRRTDPPTEEVYAKRICDPCAAYSDGYQRLRRQVSNFVHPAWFGS